MAHCEIERKYLIAMPDPCALARMPGCEVWQIEQIYLRSEPGVTRRIRRVIEGDQVRYYRTVKRRISALSAEEDERQIDRAEYEEDFANRDPNRQTISKTRYRIPHCGQIMEIDLYSFWTDRATLEIELTDESEIAHLPDWLRVIRDVTADARYKNTCLAREVPMENID